MKQVNVRISENMHRNLKYDSIDKNTTLQELFNNYLVLGYQLNYFIERFDKHKDMTLSDLIDIIKDTSHIHHSDV